MARYRQSRQVTKVGIIAATLGVVLFAWFVRRIGPAEIWAGFRQVGWGVLLISAIAGLRFVSRAGAWILCLEAPSRMAFTEAFAAVVAGDAFGNLTPLGPIVGEPAKVAFVRGRVPLGPAATALAIENVLYTLSAGAMIAAGFIALLFTFDLPGTLQQASELSIAAVVVLFIASLWMLRRQPAVLSRSLAALVPGASKLAPRLERIRRMENEIYTFAARRPQIVLAVVAAELMFHALGVLEIYVTWWLMQGSAPALLTSFILEGANRLLTVVFKFVPLRLGVDEAGTAAFTRVLGYGATPGATLAVVRKVRVLLWTTVGTMLLVRRGLSPRRVLEDVELRTSEIPGNRRTLEP